MTMELIDPVLAMDDEVPALPLPEIVDATAVLLVGLLGGRSRPLVLDARAVREVEPGAAPMLASLLRAKRDAGIVARLEGAPEVLCRGELAAYCADRAGDEVFVCPDRDELGFTPSGR
ncbi:MAG TPA: hypothetical protein VJT67_03030 [Longimicrobiaceae bacterium]|nr:hypothetical protein [Longimicrobiaceae bacterium]